jgi:glycosyltransferase involved in cell wall biosynthesis
MQFSIVTPSLNCSPWLKLCIASVADQGVAVEHIVQDGGSDDGTLDWLEADSRVSACVEPDCGMYDAINRGFSKATGEVFAYLNCDEQYLPGALAAANERFDRDPDLDVLFADVVVVNPHGEYLCHRKVQVPLLYHTWLCHLNTLTCATFFRRRVMHERGGWFNPELRADGDGQWMRELIRQGARMAVLRRFTSAYSQLGTNLGGHSKARQEKRESVREAPLWARTLKPAFVAQHWVRRLLDGAYQQAPFDYSIYTMSHPGQRTVFNVRSPAWRWRQG